MNAPSSDSPQPASSPSIFATVARDIKISHTVFAMPFALLGTMLAAAFENRFPRWQEGLLVIGCMVSARSYAMCVNRAADAHIDANNPRTASRAVPSGTLSRTRMSIFAGAFAVLFLLCCTGFTLAPMNNTWPICLALPVLCLLALYSFAKRFTALCHIILGLSLAISPPASGIALAPDWVTQPAAWTLPGMILCWVAGFDILYAMQDLDSDRQHGLHSIPAKLGVRGALWTSRFLHLIACVMLALTWHYETGVGTYFGIASIIGVGLLSTEHLLIAKDRKKHLPMAFFTLNGIYSLLLGAAGIIDVVIQRS